MHIGNMHCAGGFYFANVTVQADIRGAVILRKSIR
jgi:hypothetical protein